jgi:alcohol dehydrogenase class IV
MPPRVVFGIGAVRDLATEVDQLGARRLLVVAGRRELDRQAPLLAELGGRVSGTFDGVRPHVPVPVAEAARAAAEASAADAILAIGGGSAIGTAKAIALTTGLPIVAVPTTYAGSEMTPVWGLTDQAGKRTGTDPRVAPQVVIYDPDLVASLPHAEAMASGVNALAHAIDALWAPKINPDLAVRATGAATELTAGLDRLSDDSDDPAARSVTLHGAMLAAQVFAAAGSGFHHKICHVLGGRYDLPHSATHAVVLPHVVAFNVPAAPEAGARIADALGAGDPILALFARLRSWGVPRRLSDLGLTADQIPEAAEAILPAVPSSNPRAVSRADLIDLLSHAYAGGM